VAFTEQGRRSSRKRTAIRARLDDDRQRFVSAQALYDELRGAGESIGLATVYRTLQAMVDAGEVDQLRTDDGEMVYRKCGAEHHHHLVCRQCGKAVEVSGPAVERWAAKAADEHGFTEVAHSVELFGTCADCA